MSCEDPDCPACRLGDLFQAFKKQGVEVEDLIPFIMHTLGEVYDEIEVTAVNVKEAEHGTIH